MSTEKSKTTETAMTADPLLAAVLEYVKNEGIRLYKMRMEDDVDYDSVMIKIDAFEIVESHVKKQLKNGS